ncbi:MAG TPA: ATP-binding protein [Bryobacteraceae bacterium]|nr:ATP-binding protein [Bryobacteraceae bacterium]
MDSFTFVPYLGDRTLGSDRANWVSAVMFGNQITHRNIFRVLIAGFGLVIVLLLTAGFMSVKNVQSIKESSARLVAEELVTSRLIQGLQREQKTLNAVFYNIARTPDSVDAGQILAQLQESDRAIQTLVVQAAGTPEEHAWLDLQDATTGFSAEVRRLLNLEEFETLASADLLRRHQQVISTVSKLLSSGYLKASAAQRQIESRSSELVKDSIGLLGSSLLLAILCAMLTVRMTTELFRKMEWQAGELSRVSWHLLENQETTARRFSHELHDELGQSLTAIKANLLSMESANGMLNIERLTDARQMVDEAIRNVRELSQLLRPVILDDFGLDAGLRSLTEGFEQRTGISVEYESDFSGRLADETETHLFRIVQEALTNVARHSGAKRVRIELHAGPDKLQLSIRDDGHGLAAAEAQSTGLGMIGMRARARSAGGELRIDSRQENGVRIAIWVPLPAGREAHDTHLVG